MMIFSAFTVRLIVCYMPAQNDLDLTGRCLNFILYREVPHIDACYISSNNVNWQMLSMQHIQLPKSVAL